MKYNPKIHRRKSIRLKDYDYSKKGMYFITICTENRECILGNIEEIDSIANQDEMPIQMKLNNIGGMIDNIYLELENQIKNIKIHDYVIMPNHLHGIIEIYNSGAKEARADMESAPTLNEIIQIFKRYTTVEYIKGVKRGEYKPFYKRIWQRNYYEHIIRNEKELHAIIEYIKYNPLNWTNDSNYKE